MAQSERTRRLLIALAALVGTLAILGIAWLLRPTDPVEPRDASASDESTISATVGDEETDAGEASPESTAPDGSVTATAPESPAPSERVPALIVSARTEDGATILSVDYIQFLTGEEAALAAADRGDESPPPNDYYIVNDNTRLREFTVQEGISVLTVVQDDGTSDPGGHTLPLDAWVALLSGPAGDAFKSSFYWLTVSGETITTIEQQYLP